MGRVISCPARGTAATTTRSATTSARATGGAMGAAGTTMSNIDVRNNVFFTTGGVKQVRVGGVFSGNGSNRFVGNAYYGGRGSTFNIDWGGQSYGSIDSWRW